MRKTYFNTGYVSANFYDPLVEDSTNNGELKKALVATEGSFRDSSNIEHSFSVSRLEKIAEHTNRALHTGHSLPVCTDHIKTIENTVGFVNGGASVKMITEEDLPNKKAAHLIGKMGLFLDDVVIKTKEVAEKVRDKIISSVSMGLNLDPNDHRIMELSLVTIPAIPHMGLFKLADDEIYTWDDLEINEQTIDDIKESYNTNTENLWKILNNIYTSESIDITDTDTLRTYVYAALNGFSLRIVDILGLTSEGDNSETSPASNTPQDAVAAAATKMEGVAQASYKRSPKYVANFVQGTLSAGSKNRNKYIRYGSK